MESLRRSPVTATLFAINLTLFLSEEIFRLFFDCSLFPFLALSREGLADGGWWQLITHAFLHGNLLHLAVNMVALWFTGPLIEELLGPIRYLALYLGGAVVGGILQTLATPGSVDLVGASGSVCALLVGFGTLFPNIQITALILFVIPVKMKAFSLGWLVIVGSLLFWAFGIERQIGHLAHLGGGIAGFLICFLYKKLGMVRSLAEIPPPLPD
jgi:hypothetical protein